MQRRTKAWFKTTKTGVFPIELVDAQGNARPAGEVHVVSPEECAARFPAAERSK